MPDDPKLPAIPRRQVTVVRAPRQSVPSLPSGSYNDAIGGIYHRVFGNHNTRAAEEAGRVKEAQVAVIEHEARRIAAHEKLIEAEARRREAPERLAHEINVRRIQRADEIEEALHVSEMNYRKHLTQLAQAESELTVACSTRNLARADYIDSAQTLKAQMEYGHIGHEIHHQQKVQALLDIQLEVEERRALYTESMKAIGKYTGMKGDDNGGFEAQLVTRRQQLEDAGMDTAYVDAILKRKQKT